MGLKYFTLYGVAVKRAQTLPSCIHIYDEVRRGAGAQSDCKIDWLWVRTPLEEMKYLIKFIFPFLRSAVEETRGVEFCHSTGNSFRIAQNVSNGVP